MKSYRIIYSGRVQGVFFRASALELSARYDVTGYVRNLSDGTVELVAEGSEQEIKDFLSEVKEAKDSYIENIQIQEDRPEGYADFSIRED